MQGEGVKVIAAQKFVDLQRAFAKDFRKPPLRRAAQHRHLPKPILRMGKAKREIDILIGRPEDMGDVVIVAHDLDRGGEAVDGEGFAVIGDGARQEIVKDDEGEQRQRDQPREQAQHPAEDGEHSGPVLWDGKRMAS